MVAAFTKGQVHLDDGDLGNKLCEFDFDTSVLGGQQRSIEDFFLGNE